MCRFKSGICLKDRVFVPDYDSHSRMLEELHIEDDFAHASKVFVRVELSPIDGDKTSDVGGWKLNVDQDVLPDWWDETVDLPRIKAAVKSWCDIHVLRNGAHMVRDGVWYAYDSANVKAYGSANVTAVDSASVKAYDNANVTACGSASVKAYDNANVTACGSANVKAYSSANVTAYDSANVKACGSASVKAYNSANVKAYDNANVILPKLYQTSKPVVLHDEAICINHRDHTIQSPVTWVQKEA